MEQYWKHAMQPFQMADDFYYVGTEKGPTYLLCTSEGLVLIDTGYAQTLYLVLENIRSLGFDPYDIRHILHSHGHCDHIGGTRALVELTGAKTYIGAPDADAAAGRNDLLYASELGFPFEEPFEADVLLHDGDILNFGDKTVRCVATPGHTAGTVSFFFDVRVNDIPYRAGMFGGAGLNTLTREYLIRHGLPLCMRNCFLDSIERLKKEKVDFHVGNHLSDNCTREKKQRLNEEVNPFLAGKTWIPFLEKKKADAEVFFEKY